jgi:ADP-heptose:LPS heptosyltransferase
MRFLIVRIGALGDFIQTLPAIGTIRHYFPDATMDLMGCPSILELAHGRYYAHHISRFDQAGISAFFTENPSFREALVNYLKEFDVIVSYVGSSGIFSKNLKRVNTKKVLVQNSLPQPGGKVHIIDHLLKPVLDLGLEPFSKIPKVYLTEEDKKFAESFFCPHGAQAGNRMAIAIHPGSGGRQKCWPVERFAEVIRRLSEEAVWQILLVEGPADADRVRKILELAPECKPTRLNHLSLPKLAAVLEKCDAFLGNDSGVTHLAAAVGTKVLALFGPTDPAVWGPRGENVTILYHPDSCSPCPTEQRKACRSQDCLENIDVVEVMDVLRTFAIRAVEAFRQ